MGNERGRLIASVESRSVPREGEKEKLIHSFINAENGEGGRPTWTPFSPFSYFLIS